MPLPMVALDCGFAAEVNLAMRGVGLSAHRTIEREVSTR
jgi:hypothetical protein